MNRNTALFLYIFLLISIVSAPYHSFAQTPVATETEDVAEPDAPKFKTPKVIAGFAPLPSKDWASSSLEDLGITESMKQYNTQPTMTVWFFTRGDEVLTDSRLRLALSTDAADWVHVRGVEIIVNDEPMITIDRKMIGSGKMTIPIDARLLGPDNSLTFRLLTTDAGSCASQLVKGKWKLIKEGFIDTEGSALPLQSDLALLPLPFFDPKYDRVARINVVFPTQPDENMLKAAGLVAAAFGLQTGSRIKFTVFVGEVPDTNSVVIGVDTDNLGDVKLPGTTAPTLRMIDHPAFIGSNRKLLVLQGKTTEDLVIAAKHLTLSESGFSGDTVTFAEDITPPTRIAYDAPRWLPAKPLVAFEEIKGGDKLVHKGLIGGTMAMNFRIAPDLFAWPRDLIRMDIRYTQIAPSTEYVPTVTVELNGKFLTTLHKGEIRDGMYINTQPVEIHRSRLRGFNRLEFHVSWPNFEDICRSDADFSDEVSTTISPNSTIHFEDIPHFAEMPNIATFVEDGFPFSKMADLSDTAVVVPRDASPGDMATMLSVMAHLSAVTGYPGINATFLFGDELTALDKLNKNLLVAGNVKTLSLLDKWSNLLPVKPVLGRLEVRTPSMWQQTRALVGGNRVAVTAKKANDILTRTPKTAVIAGIESPLEQGRSAVVITALDDSTMPALYQFMGYTTAEEAGGDLMLVSNQHRWRFTIGPEYGIGKLVWYTQARWISSNHWLVLIPSLFIVVFMFAGIAREYLQRKAYDRLHPEDK